MPRMTRIRALKMLPSSFESHSPIRSFDQYLAPPPAPLRRVGCREQAFAHSDRGPSAKGLDFQTVGENLHYPAPHHHIADTDATAVHQCVALGTERYDGPDNIEVALAAAPPATVLAPRFPEPLALFALTSPRLALAQPLFLAPLLPLGTELLLGPRLYPARGPRPPAAAARAPASRGVGRSGPRAPCRPPGSQQKKRRHAHGHDQHDYDYDSSHNCPPAARLEAYRLTSSFISTSGRRSSRPATSTSGTRTKYGNLSRLSMYLPTSI